MTDKKVIFKVVPEDELDREETPDGWHKISDYDDFVKWQYKDTPYRVVATLHNQRGHWRSVFTTSFSRSDYALIRGNLGGGRSGRRKAIAAAKQFLEDNKNGCPPPGEIKL